MLHLKNLNKEFISKSSRFLERIMAVIVFIAILAAILSLWEPFWEFWQHRTEHGAFFEFIDFVFNVVIVIEFFKLLCTPGKDTLLEVLMFVVARHMIIEETSPMENLISILSIGVLFLIDRFLLGNLRFRRDLPEEKAEKAGSDSFRQDAEAACEEISASRTDR